MKADTDEKIALKSIIALPLDPEFAEVLRQEAKDCGLTAPKYIELVLKIGKDRKRFIGMLEGQYTTEP